MTKKMLQASVQQCEDAVVCAKRRRRLARRILHFERKKKYACTSSGKMRNPPKRLKTIKPENKINQKLTPDPNPTLMVMA
jgi:hypothetical protein